MPGVHVNVVKKCRKTPVVKYYLVSVFSIYPSILSERTQSASVIIVGPAW